jgi:lauroyl/myristoyl acyltransferase
VTTPGVDATSSTVAADAPRRWTLHSLNNGVIFKLTLLGVRWLPRQISYALGRSGSWLCWRFMTAATGAIADNLSAVVPEESRAERRRRALETYKAYANDAVDFLRALDAADATVRTMFAISDADRAAFLSLLGLKRGLLIVTGHFGNWEAGAVLMRRVLDLPLTVVTMAEPDPAVNADRVEIRRRLGVETIEVRQSLDTALRIRRALSQNRAVALLADRHIGRDRVAVRLLGRPVWFLRTPALLAALTGAPLLPCIIERVAPGRFSATFGAPVEIEPGEPRDQAITRAAQALADALEPHIKAHPEYWYHFYRYWDAQRDDYTGLE